MGSTEYIMEGEEEPDEFMEKMKRTKQGSAKKKSAEKITEKAESEDENEYSWDPDFD
jgi:hypothetical protein